jgi:acetyltransferase-like isoleucine patch superfamily enzyme/acyl carrier protein
MNRVHARLVKARTARWLRACARVGEDPAIDGKPTLFAVNGGRIEVGDRFHLSSRPVPSHLVSWGVLRIGDDVSIGHGSAIAASVSVSIGDRTRIAPFFVLMDTDFHGERARAGVQPTTRTAMGADSGFAPVQIGTDVHIAAHVTVLRGASIGDGATIASGSVVNGRIPPGVLAGGVPARVLGDPSEPEGADPPGTEVLAIVTRVFGLSTPPDPRSGPDEIAQWDSLGALKLLLSVEEALGVSLAQDVVAGIRSVADLQTAVEDARRHASTR